MQRITPDNPYPLFSTTATRRIEQTAQATLPHHTLMQRAGLAVARLSLALAPHAQTIWIACGPGNNGGDGLEAAMHLQLWGKHPIVTWLGTPEKAPPDALASYFRAKEAGVNFSDEPPVAWDFCIDALLGIGGSPEAPRDRMADWITSMNAASAPILAIDVPTGLQADTGLIASTLIAGRAYPVCARAQFTLSLLTLKPGLFTADGRDMAGEVWLDDLGLTSIHQMGNLPICTARLQGPPLLKPRQHASHKGSYGDVAVIGGAPGMTGAAMLAASAALHAGAGRVFVGLLDAHSPAFDVTQPELMFRQLDTLNLVTMTVVCGCGGGTAIEAVLPQVLATANICVIDADALNAITKNKILQAQLLARNMTDKATVLTPHPLEAARLLGQSTGDIQANRLLAAEKLANKFQCVVVLKGSGTVIAAPNDRTVVNPTGNPLLATGGTGDVLAGMLGSALASGIPAFQAACEAVYRHGAIADIWPSRTHHHITLTAGHLARSA